LFSALLNLFLKHFDFEKSLKPYIHKFGKHIRRYRPNFYIALAVGFLGYIVFTLLLSLSSGDIKKSTFDFAIQNRISGPSPSPEILIIDIDEKSIAELSPKFGRWPWPREMLAEVISGMEDAKPSVIYLNMLLSEVDIANKNSDNTLALVLSQYENVITPWLRLNPKNDGESKFLAKDIPGFQVVTSDKAIEEIRTAALIPSLFSDAKNHHGFANLKEDSDGIIRRFYTKIKVPGGVVPSSSFVAAQVSTKSDLVSEPKEIFLNWRNKKGGYKRISFSDLYKQFQGDGDILPADGLTNKIIVLGVSAPGLANLKPTASSNLIDDNEIIANAIDDMVNKTYLKLTPIWFDKLISACLIILFCLAFLYGSLFLKINTLVGFIQSALALITLGFISYTTYFVDLSGSIALSLSYFAICKFHQSIDKRAIRAEELFSASELSKNITNYSVLVFSDKEVDLKIRDQALRAMELNLGASNIFLIDNIFDGGNLLGNLFKPVSAFIIFTSAKSSVGGSIFTYIDNDGAKKEINFLVPELYYSGGEINNEAKRLDDKTLRATLSKACLRLALDLMSNEKA
jgi:CHASE2 domain-containing sensor protein